MPRRGATGAGFRHRQPSARFALPLILCGLLSGALPVHAQDVDRDMELARKHLRLNRWDRALQKVQIVLEAQPDNIEAWLIKAEAALGQQDNNTAIEAYTKASHLAPGDLELKTRLADLLQRRNDRLTDALRIYEEVLYEDSASVRALISIGSIHERRSQWSDAADSYRAVLKIDPNFVRARSNLGAVLFKLGDYKGASRELRKAIELSPFDLRSHVFFGLSQNHLGHYDVALQGLKDALLIDPHSANQLIGVGEQLPQFHRLTRIFEQRYEESPREAGRSYDLAVIYFYSENYGEAWRFLVKAENLKYPVPVQFKEVTYSRRSLELMNE